ncbi:MAG TPA: DUF2344 domain-containing protein [Firmicutes bacterium]|nr:DUF2344 domain-containing protein [Bacillota bacterium]
MRIRVKLAKDEAARFISHLDLAGAVEKAVRRAGLPIAYSEGFTPRPKIAFASALALGATSTAEYADFELRERLPIAEFVRRLRAQLPEGLRLLAAREVAAGAPALMAEIDAAGWEVAARLPGLRAAEVARAWEEFLARERIYICKETKHKRRDLDIRPLILKARLVPCDEGGTWDLLLRSGSSGNLRPEEVLTAFFAAAGWEGKIERIHRTGLYIERWGELMTPLVEPRVPEEAGESE